MAITLTLTTNDQGGPVTFISSGVKIGDEVLMTGAPSNMFTQAIDPNDFMGTFNVTGIASETSLTYDAFLNGVPQNLTLNSGATSSTVDYKIVHNLTKDEQIAAIVAYAKNLQDKRVTLVWPPACYVTQADAVAGLVTDGTFLAACLASAKSAYPAQQGFTNLPIAGPYQLLYSNNYFNKTQLKALVDAGVFVFVQDAPGANIYALRQVTTDPSSFENYELSCVTSEDKISADLISIIKPYIGKYNITQDYLTVLNDIANAYVYKAKSQKAPMCGALMLNGSVDSILANISGSNPAIPDGTVEVTVSAELGKPANWVKIKLLVS